MAEFFDNLKYLFSTLKIYSIIDIALVSYLIYRLLIFIRDTRAATFIKGIIIIIAAYFLSHTLNLYLLHYIIQIIVDNGVLALVIMFQPELRKALEHVGNSKFEIKKFLGGNGSDEENHKKTLKTINAVSEGFRTLQKQHMGALVVFEGSTHLGDIARTGTILDSVPSPAAIGNIFFNKAPLHDGALIVRDNKLFAAGCILPLTQNNKIDSSLGTRHRAAIGMSEASDAVVVVLSEETGTFSIAINGNISRYNSITEFTAMLVSLLLPDNNASAPKRFSFSDIPSYLSKKPKESRDKDKEQEDTKED